MLATGTRVVRVMLAAMLVATGAVVIQAFTTTEAGAHTRGPDHVCVVDPESAECIRWRHEHGDGADPAAPVCTHLGEFVPCRSPWLFEGYKGWWVGDIAGSYPDWSVWRTNEFSGVDEPLPHGALHGCWAYRFRPTGTDQESRAPGDDPDRDGWWYRVLCLTDRHTFSNAPDLIRMPGFHGEVMAWRAGGTGPAGDLDTAIQRAVAALDIQDPQPRTAPPSATGSLPFGMPVWLALDTTPAQWGPLTATGCDQDLCVEVWSQVVTTSWDTGDGHTEDCTRDQNLIWQLGDEFLDPVGYNACHHYYEQPSRDMPEGHYPIEATATWHTHWRAPTLGITDWQPTDPLHTHTTATIRVEEVQVVVRSRR